MVRSRMTPPWHKGETRRRERQAYIDNLFYVQGRFWDVATDNDLYMAAAYTVRDRLRLGERSFEVRLAGEDPVRARRVVVAAEIGIHLALGEQVP